MAASDPYASDDSSGTSVAPGGSSYDLASVKAPRLSGLALRIFAWLLERGGLVARLVLPKLYKDVGLTRFRKLEPRSAPTLLPVGIADASLAPREAQARPLDYAEARSNRSPFDLEELIRITALADEPERRDGFHFRSAADFARAYREHRTNPADVAERLIRCIAESNAGPRPLRAILASRRDDVFAQAEASARRWREGKPLGPLDGVPIAVKDELDQRGYGSAAGTQFLGRTPASRDATVVERLRERGALLFGKANMQEIGIGVTGINPWHGIARNPYDPAHCSGGSSSGSGAAVAAGLGPIALGADGGGSIRIPAALCGVFGLKATFGRISEHGAVPLCWSVAHVGPLAASATDLALSYAAIAGPDERDPVSMRQPDPHGGLFAALGRGGSLEGMTLGIYEPWFDHADPEIVRACRKAVEDFESMGAVIRRIEIAGLEAMRMAHAVTILTEMADFIEPHYARRRAQLAGDTRINLVIARRLTSRDYLKAQRIRTEAIAEFARAFYEVDAILSPAAAIPAPIVPQGAEKVGYSDLDATTEIMRYAFASNLTGNPAVTFPAGYTSRGLPVGMQAIGRRWEESSLLQLCFAAERRPGFARKKPAQYFDLLEGAGEDLSGRG